jgi:hypothetical protein
MRLLRSLLVLVAAVVAAPGPAGAYNVEQVIATPRVELQPAAGLDYLAFSKDVAGHPNRFNLWVIRDSGPIRVNPSGTRAFAGSIDGDTLAYFQRRLPDGRADIKFFDLINSTRSEPEDVNTTRHETSPQLSGEWLMFLRSRNLTSPRRLLLWHLGTTDRRELDFGDDAYIQTAGLAGNYAAWTRCPRPRRCSTNLYDVTTETQTTIPNPLDKSQFAASVTADGTVYYAESGTILCNDSKVVRFYRQPLIGERELLATLPPGRDTAVTSPVIRNDGSIDVYFDRFNPTCTKSDIYRIPIPAPGP